MLTEDIDIVFAHGGLDTEIQDIINKMACEWLRLYEKM